MDANTEKILKKVHCSIEESKFYSRTFSQVAKWQKRKRKDFSPLTRLLQEEYDTLSRRLDLSKVQSGPSVRNVQFCKNLSELLFDEKGLLRNDRVQEAIVTLEKNLYSLGPGQQVDSSYQRYALKVLKRLLHDKELVTSLHALSRPPLQSRADHIIKETLRLPRTEALTNRHVRVAALSALLTYLRQNVGSCFATAPAILIQQEQPVQLLLDLQELLNTGQLKRVFSGVEYAVPLSLSFGSGDLRKEVTLRSPPDPEGIKLWASPGLLEALEATGKIDRTKKLREKIKKVKELLCYAVKKRVATGGELTLSVEEWIEALLIDDLGLDANELKEFEERPQPHQMGLLVKTPASKNGAKRKKINQFYSEYETAKNVFLSLADNALLKTWEFTLASFAESKAQFTTWNLYTSLGLQPEDEGGIGPRLYAILQGCLNEANEQVAYYQELHEQIYALLQHIKQRMQRASSDKEAEWIRMDYRAKRTEFESLEQQRNHFHTKAQMYANAYNFLIEMYFELFPKYFQEVYDADIHEVAQGPYDDSPAGFRLLFKHGRSVTSQWTPVTNHIEFIDALVEFFTMTEYELKTNEELQGIEEDLSRIVSDIVSHVRSDAFLESAFYRMAIQHKKHPIQNPLENLEKIEAKPWVYTSGGSMSTLVSSYFRLEASPQEVSRWVESPTELLTFLLDSLKELPEKEKDTLRKDPEKSLLIHSPTHAFLLKPNFPHFRMGWENDLFTYTWVRDEVIHPQQAFYDQMFLNEDVIAYLIRQLSFLLPTKQRHLFLDLFSGIGGSLHVREFVPHVERLFASRMHGGQFILDALDSVLFTHLPVFPIYQFEERLSRLLQHLPGVTESDHKKMMQLYKGCTRNLSLESVLGARHLQNTAKALLALYMRETKTKVNYPLAISQRAQNLGYAAPAPFIVADTNWVSDFFAFVVGPTSGHLEFWRVDRAGTEGFPMSTWTRWLSGKEKKPDWGLFHRPFEYVL